MRFSFHTAAAMVVILYWGAPAVGDVQLPGNPRYVFQPMGDSAGLATRTVVTMIQDKWGFVWAGTHTGLYRFDGVKAMSMEQSPGRPWSYVSQLEQDSKGRVWVSADGALSHFDGVHFIPIRLPVTEDRSVRSLDVPQRMAFDAKDNLFLATTRGVVRLAGEDRNQWRQWAKREGLPADNVVAVHVAPDGVLWFAAGGKVGTLDPKTHKVRIFEIFGARPAEKIIAILVNKAGNAWVRTQKNLFSRPAGAAAFAPVKADIAEALGDGRPALDRRGRILVPSRAGVFYKHGGRWVRLSAESGLRTSSVASVLEDREGELWFGLDGSGLCRWPGGRDGWAAWTTDNGLPDNGVWASMYDSRKRLWVATNNGLGIWQPKARRWKTLRRADGIAGHGVWKTIENPGGEVWSISRRVGLNRYDPEALVPRPVKLPVACKSGPTDLAYDRKRGVFWMAGNDYLYKITASAEPRFEAVSLPAELAGCTEVVAVASGGVLWTGGRNGLGRFDGRAWRRFSARDGLAKDYVQYISPVAGDDVWLDYRGPVGITRLKLGGGKPRVTHLTRKLGLLSDTVWLLDRDAGGQLWVGHSNGLSVVGGDGRIRHITRHDGLIWNDIAQAGFLSVPGGGVFIGTSRGLAFHRSGGRVSRALPPALVLTSVQLGGRELLGKRDVKVLYDENSLAVKFSGVTFRNPHAAVFRYQLVGLDREYIESKVREVRYSALPAGTFTFEVSCRSAAGQWSNKARFTFTVGLPWWERLWVRLCGGFAVLLLLALILQARTYKLAADRRRLERAVKERSAQLAEANDQLEVANQRLRELSFTDGLTQVHNRHFYSSVIDTEVQSAHRRGDPRARPGRNRDLVFFMVDLDHFKSVNDTWGHSAGDRVLVETARRLQESIRTSDLLVRWGGEEFLILCKETELGEAEVVARRILEVVQEAPFWLDGSHNTRRTCSVGWAALPTSSPELAEIVTHEVAIDLADQALYVAKESGRNRAVGVELLVDAVAKEPDTMWLEQPLAALEGKLVRLIHVAGAGEPEES